MWEKEEILDWENVMARIPIVRDLLADIQIITVNINGRKQQVECLIIPAVTKEGEKRTPIFNYPGGLTHLFPCIEPLLYLDRRSITISPLGYGGSSDIPNSIFQDNPLHGSEVLIQVLRKLGEKEVIFYAHSNGAPIVVNTALTVASKGIDIKEIILVNPLGLRQLSKLWVAVAFPFSGMLTRLFSWGTKNPLDYLKDAYQASKHPFSIAKIWYELNKSCQARLTTMLQKLQNRGKRIPITVVQSSWDWASFHWPWNKSNEEILKGIIPLDLLSIKRIPGSHNVTLGKESKELASAIIKMLPIIIIPLGFHLLPYSPILAKLVMSY